MSDETEILREIPARDPVFVDETGRRGRVVRRAVYGLVSVCLASMTVVGASLAVGHRTPMSAIPILGSLLPGAVEAAEPEELPAVEEVAGTVADRAEQARSPVLVPAAGPVVPGPAQPGGPAVPAPAVPAPAVAVPPVRPVVPPAAALVPPAAGQPAAPAGPPATEGGPDPAPPPPATNPPVTNPPANDPPVTDPPVAEPPVTPPPPTTVVAEGSPDPTASTTTTSTTPATPATAPASTTTTVT